MAIDPFFPVNINGVYAIPLCFKCNKEHLGSCPRENEPSYDRASQIINAGLAEGRMDYEMIQAIRNPPKSRCSLHDAEEPCIHCKSIFSEILL